jgi:hypothetical protein
VTAGNSIRISSTNHDDERRKKRQHTPLLLSTSTRVTRLEKRPRRLENHLPCNYTIQFACFQFGGGGGGRHLFNAHRIRSPKEKLSSSILATNATSPPGVTISTGAPVQTCQSTPVSNREEASLNRIYEQHLYRMWAELARLC